MDRLVERFNCTLLQMFTMQLEAEGWDEYLQYLLFAHMKVPQQLTGFSLFEFLYDWRVSGPLNVLRIVCTSARV